MPIRAVVLDIGGVLEVIDDEVFPGDTERRLGLPPGGFSAALAAAAPLAGEPMLGEVTEAGVRRHWRDSLGVDDDEADRMMADFWRWYAGTLDRQLFDWFASQRPERLTGILSNSAPGAREAERHHGFEQVTDDLVYSHEVGLTKPDPRIYTLTARRLGVAPAEIVFLDDVEDNISAAREAGWHAVLHRDTPSSIAALEALIADVG